jgi:hypothetical protein
MTEAEMAAGLEKQHESLKEIIPNLKNYLSVDERLALKLKLEGKAFKVEKYVHNYPIAGGQINPFCTTRLTVGLFAVLRKKTA